VSAALIYRQFSFGFRKSGAAKGGSVDGQTPLTSSGKPIKTNPITPCVS